MNDITITLPVQAWNSILNIIGDRPFKEVAELISEIKRQAESQMPQIPVAESMETEATVQ
jgi:hypothetical protein